MKTFQNIEGKPISWPYGKKDLWKKVRPRKTFFKRRVFSTYSIPYWSKKAEKSNEPFISVYVSIVGNVNNEG